MPVIAPNQVPTNHEVFLFVVPILKAISNFPLLQTQLPHISSTSPSNTKNDHLIDNVSCDFLQYTVVKTHEMVGKKAGVWHRVKGFLMGLLDLFLVAIGLGAHFQNKKNYRPFYIRLAGCEKPATPTHLNLQSNTSGRVFSPLVSPE